MWQVVHFSSITFFRPGLRLTSELTLACQSGSLAALAIMVARQCPVMDMSLPRPSVRSSWQTPQRPEPTKLSVTKVASPVPGRGCAGAGLS
jgi:hypothetical protein